MRTIQLGQLFKLSYGKSLRKDSRIHGEVPVYGSNGTVDVHNESLVSKPTIVVGRKGSIGEVHLVSIPCWPIDTTYFVESLGKHDYDLEWLFRLLKNLRLQNLNRSAAIPGLNRDDVYRIEIPFPPLDDQKRIAHLLGKVEGLIARRKQHLRQLDDLLKSVFLEMFGDPVRNEKGWDIEPLARLIAHQPNNGLYKPQSSYGSGTKIIRIDSFYDGYVQSLENLKRVEITNSEYEKYRIETDDILINRVNSIEYLGKLGVVKNIDEHMVYESNIMRFRVDKQAILPIFLMFVWRLPFVKSQITNRAKKAVNQASINQKDVLSFVVPKPPIPLQNQFAAIVEKVEGLKSRYQQSLTDLESLYGALSQKAFKGELNLSQVVLPAEGPELAEEETTDIDEEKQPMEPLFELPAPEELAVLQTAAGRKSLLGEWLNSWLAQLGDAPFAAQKFMDAARQRLWELAEDEAPDWGAAEYDELKTQVFEALEQDHLIQGYDDANNRVQITAAKG
ncbi:hypothetical protein CKO35_15945 [Ectothiorhodospira shaposhnikovii]|uniref:restriction endonuclease subunit S n=1 Tax=Ectothiorhodospira shaposhnikovii TaxID=1054 RepID=UPI001903E469|nr:restriction endonuclease subunit S [Ectothiorhodospira shaposhnikovii]MBK1674755.1 hypothetical protein [Ectothiorhodospira shaposhnikovii]